MKIQCDVCSKKEASVYCSADEAALCDECDQSIHHANKLASKHQRLSVLQPSSSDFPICDICQEKRALIFCQQDRAILCRDCEIPLHTSNEHTKKHNRFLLTGVKLSSTIISNIIKKDDAIISCNNYGCDQVPSFKPTKLLESELSGKTSTNSNSNSKSADASDVVPNSNNTDSSAKNSQLMINNGGSTTSNISEYLIDMLPGWHFEDLIVDSASPPAPFGFCKSNHNFEVNEDVMSFFEDKELTSPSSTHQFENFWVPQATHFTTTPTTATTYAGMSRNVFGQQQQHHSSGIHHNYTSGLNFGTKQQQQETSVNSMKMNRKYLKDDVFTVPQICSSVGSKRNRPFW